MSDLKESLKNLILQAMQQSRKTAATRSTLTMMDDSEIEFFLAVKVVKVTLPNGDTLENEFDHDD